jgi:hypothetical protein
MKLFTFLTFLFLTATSFSQSPLFDYWDFQLDTVSTSQFSIDSTNQDDFIWQIGESHKPFFGTTTVLATDTLQMYNGPIDATINMEIVKQSQQYGGFVVEFEHKIDTDTNHAGGFFEINLDNDSTRYVNSNNDTVSTYWVKLTFNSETDLTEHYTYEGMTNLITQNNDTVSIADMIETNYYDIWSLTSNYYLSHGYTDTLFNNTNGFTGTYDDYKTFYLDFMFEEGGVKVQDIRDTLNFRFHFVSNATSSNKNGWAIRNIKTGYSVHPTGSLEENTVNSEIETFPNPTHSKFNFKVKTHEKENITVEIYNVVGVKIQSIQKTIGDSVIDLTNYSNGIYYINYLSKNGIIGYSKVMKL